jgi:hypothetical protein
MDLLNRIDTALRRRLWAVVLVSFAAGSLITARLVHVADVRADSNRVFELRIYHATPGKVPALETRFRDMASKQLAKHDLKAVGYWIPEETPGWENTFVYILAHPSREDAKKNWASMFADPEFKKMMEMEKTEKLVEKVDLNYMRPTDFSAMK